MSVYLLYHWYVESTQSLGHSSNKIMFILFILNNNYITVL